MRRMLVAALLALLCPILIGFVLLMPTRNWPRVGGGLFGVDKYLTLSEEALDGRSNEHLGP